MKRSMGKNIVTAIDVGTTKICVLIAHVANNKILEVLGIGKACSEGLSKGMVIDIKKATSSIKSAIKEAELMAGCNVENAYVGISGAHIKARTLNGMITVKSGKITQKDVDEVLAAAKAINLPEGQRILHVLPQYYNVDDCKNIADPIGMHCMRLEVYTYVITGAVSLVQNLVRCCQLAGVEVEDVVLESLASAYSVLSKDERSLGVAMLDIGGGTSDFAVYYNKSILYTKVLPIAGNHITKDIALCLRTTIESAEHIKKSYGYSSFSNELDQDQNFEIEMVQGNYKQMSNTKELTEIIEYRIEELLYMVKSEIESYNLIEHMPAGLVLTGGGSLLNYISEHSSSLLDIPVRVGYPNIPESLNESLSSPIHATSYGLLLYAVNNNYNCFNEKINGPLIMRIFGKMKSWVSDFF